MTQIIGHQFAEGTSSSRPDGDAAAGPRGETGGEGFDRGTSRPDQFQIDPAAHPGGGPKDGSADVPPRSRPNSPDLTRERASPCAPVGRETVRGGDFSACAPAAARSGASPAAGEVPLQECDLVSIHVTRDAAVCVALLAVAWGETPGGVVARLAAQQIEAEGGIAEFAPFLKAATQAPDRAPASVCRPAGAPAGDAGDAAREAEQTRGIARV
jgi:hypothetical protein